MMDLTILGILIGLGLVFLLWVLFKLSSEFRRKNHPKPGIGRSQPSSPAVDKPERIELETGPPQRVGTFGAELKRR